MADTIKHRTRTRFQVAVTKSDIEKAHRSDSYQCVVAQAVARTIPDATHFDVDIQTVRFTRDGKRFVYLTPYAVQGYIVAFDAGESIQPFSFRLDAPKVHRRKERTEVGKAKNRAATRARRETKLSSDSPSTEDANKAAKVAYAAASAGYPAGARITTDTGKGDHSASGVAPKVFKRKTRHYGHRLLRINQAKTQSLAE